MNTEASNCYIVMWDMTGLECIIDAAELQSQDVMAALGDKPANRLSQTLSMLELRARLNSQRYYEIYTITTSKDIHKDDLVRLFEDHPQSAADLIRNRGQKLLGNGAGKQQVIR